MQSTIYKLVSTSKLSKADNRLISERTTMSRFKKNKTREVLAISTASLPDIVFILLSFMIVTEPPEKQTQLEVERWSELKLIWIKPIGKMLMIYIGFIKERKSKRYIVNFLLLRVSGNDDWRFVDVDAVMMTERKAGKSGANDALNVAVKKFGDNIAERGAGSELANYDIIYGSRNGQMEVVRKSNEIFPSMASEMYSTEIRKTKSSSCYPLSLNFSYKHLPKIMSLGPKCDSFLHRTTADTLDVIKSFGNARRMRVNAKPTPS